MFRVEFITCFSSPKFTSHHDAVADHHALEFNGLVHSLDGVEEIAGEVRDIHAAVRLASDPEIVGQELRESNIERFDRCGAIACCSAFVINIAWVIVDRESDSGWCLEEEQV